MPDYLHALPAGYRLDEYELVRVLGSGGFGITYLGYDHHLDKAVAIKEYLPNDLAVRADNASVLPKSTDDKADYEWGLARFLTEAQTLARFDHRHIIKVYRFFRAHGTGYIVMEYAEGETLSEVLQRKGTLTETELQALLFPILDGLAVVHEAGVLHRDIKPSNIVIRDDGSPVLIDFGSARQAVAGKSRSVTAIVTPGYAPIEQYSAKGHQGAWTDIYALGAVCYRCLTGEPPDDATERLRGDPLTPAVQRCKGKASAALLAAIDQALRVAEGERPQSVAAWRAVLAGDGNGSNDAARSAHKSKTRPAEGLTTKRAGMGRSGKMAVVVIMALLGVSIWQGWHLYRGAPGDGSGESIAVEEEKPIDPRVGSSADMALDTQAGNEAGAGTEAAQPVVEPEILPPDEEEEDEEVSPRLSLDEKKALIREAMRKRIVVGEMVAIPAGTFRMGDLSGEGWGFERLARSVSVPAFRLGKYEVTFAQWDACVADGGCNGYIPGDAGWGRGSRPVINVSWYDVQSFIDWLNTRTGGNYRLPTEAEWEYAARAGTTTAYSWGNDIGSNRANCDNDDCGDSYEYAAPVGSFPANPWGLHDMHGNVWEWVQDCQHDNYEGAPTDGSAWTNGHCGLRGGSWFGDAGFLRSANHYWLLRPHRGNIIGFRLAQDK